jgi:hypothetical protein
MKRSAQALVAAILIEAIIVWLAFAPHPFGIIGRAFGASVLSGALALVASPLQRAGTPFSISVAVAILVQAMVWFVLLRLSFGWRYRTGMQNRAP